jgi:hypothetical protein
VIVLKVEQAARMQRRKEEDHEAKQCRLVSDIYIYIYILVWIKRSLLL